MSALKSVQTEYDFFGLFFLYSFFSAAWLISVTLCVCVHCRLKWERAADVQDVMLYLMSDHRML